MAFAIASGVTPEAGIYTAIVAGFVVSSLGGSRTQISGPTGAFVVIVAGIVAKFGVSGLLMCTAMAGVMLLVMGMTGLGNAVKFIPRPVTIGFTNGIALLIASTQIKDFSGLPLTEVPSEFFPRLEALAANIGGTNFVAVTVGAATIATIVLWPARDQSHSRIDHRASRNDGEFRNCRRVPPRPLEAVSAAFPPACRRRHSLQLSRG